MLRRASLTLVAAGLAAAMLASPASAAPTSARTSSASAAVRSAPVAATPVAASDPSWEPRSPALEPFSSDSPANTSIGSGAVFESAAATKTAKLLTGSPMINSERWSIAVAIATFADPVAKVTNVSNGTVRNFRVPSGAQVTAGTDKHMTVVQPDGFTAFECYKMTRINATEWTTTYIVETDLRSSGLAAGARASGISQVMGLIRVDEVASLKIPHTLAVGLPDSMLKPGQVWPARKQDANAATAYTGPIPMGTMMGIPPSVDLTTLGLTPEGLAIGTALQDYGAHVLVRADTIALFAEPRSDAAAVLRMKVDYQKKLFPLLRVVTNNTEDNVAGGGTRRQPAAAPFTAPPVVPDPGAGPAGQYVATSPVRVLDSRIGRGSLEPVSGPRVSNGMLAANTVYSFDYASTTLPDAAAYAFNVTAVAARGAGNLSVAPRCNANGAVSTARPATSIVNYQAGKDVANFVIVPNNEKAGCNGLLLYSEGADSAVIIDVAGSYPTTSGISPVTPVRVADTRSGLGSVVGAVASGASRSFQIAGTGGIPTNATSVAVNVTASDPSAGGYLGVRPTGTALAETSNLNYIAGQDKAAFVVVKLSSTGKIDVHSAGASAGVIIDVFAYYTATSEMVTQAPARILDTRSGSALADGAERVVVVAGKSGVPLDAAAVLVSVTGIHDSASTGTGNLRVFPSGGALPEGSTLNYVSRSTDVANFAIVKLGAAGSITVRTSGSSIDVAIDVLGYLPATT